MQTLSPIQNALRNSRIGLGMAALGRPGYINLGHGDDLGANREVAAMQERASTVLDCAWEAGIRYFDAARSYGRAEEFLGQWLHARQRTSKEVFVGSKWGYTYTANWRVDAEKHEVKEHSLSVLQRQIAESREQLGEHLQLYQIHSATLDSGVLDNTEVFDELAKLRAKGLHVGLSLSGEGQAETLRKAMGITYDGTRLFATVQATWNLLERSAEEALSEAHAAGMGVIIKEALANGRLTDRNTEPGFADKRSTLQALADAQGTTIDAVALASVLARPWVDVVLSGATTETQLRSNLRALGFRWDTRIASQLETLRELPSDYWTTRSRLAWN